MRMYDILDKKRNGNELTDEEISFFVSEYSNGSFLVQFFYTVLLYFLIALFVLILFLSQLALFARILL